MNTNISFCFLVACCLFLGHASHGQEIALKTNLLYDATASFNIGAEIALGRKYTLDVSGNWNPWTFSDNMKWKHWFVQPNPYTLPTPRTHTIRQMVNMPQKWL